MSSVEDAVISARCCGTLTSQAMAFERIVDKLCAEATTLTKERDERVEEQRTLRSDIREAETAAHLQIIRADEMQHERDGHYGDAEALRTEVERLLRRRGHYECHPNPDPSWEESLDVALSTTAALRADVERLTRERDALARKVRDMGMHADAAARYATKLDEANTSNETLRAQVERLRARDECCAACQHMDDEGNCKIADATLAEEGGSDE